MTPRLGNPYPAQEWSVRTGQIADAERLARINVAAWRQAYVGLVPDRALADLDPTVIAETYRDRLAQAQSGAAIVVAHHGDTAGAFASVGPVREPSHDSSPFESTGELTALYADPTVAGTGAGHAAHEAGLGHLADQGYTHVILWALRDNLPALRFYRTHGWSPDSVARDADIAGRAVPLVRWSHPCPERPTTLCTSQ
nr:GNAT family N-acetyltransferase [Saccharopolyspora sp. HNM0983]